MLFESEIIYYLMKIPLFSDSPSSDRNPSPPPEFQEDKDLLEAGVIRNTTFSKHWLFSTLMKLIEVLIAKNYRRVL